MRELFPLLMGRILFFSILTFHSPHNFLENNIVKPLETAHSPLSPRDIMAELSTIVHFLLYHTLTRLVNEILAIFHDFFEDFPRIFSNYVCIPHKSFYQN